MNIPISLEFNDAPIGNRFHCRKCGGERFFIALEGEEKAEGPVDNIECIECHSMYAVEIKP